MTTPAKKLRQLDQILTLVYEADNIIREYKISSAYMPSSDDLKMLSIIEEKAHKLWISVCDLESDFFARKEERN